MIGAPLLLLTALQDTAAAEPLTIPREHRGARIELNAELLLPPGSAKMPAMVIQHGSGGISQAREYRYADEIVKLGVAALVIDSFTARDITSTVADQSRVTTLEMTDDTLAALSRLAAHPRIDAARIGVVGFSKGGTAALQAALEERAALSLADGPRFALHVALYPGCNNHYRRPRLTGAPILLLLGGADTYAGVAPCVELAAGLEAAGAPVDLHIYPGAEHGFDSATAYNLPNGENWSGCIFEEQTDGSWRERTSGETVTDAQGQPVVAGFQRAIAACRTLGVSGGPDPAARDAAMNEVREAIRTHLLPRP